MCSAPTEILRARPYRQASPAVEHMKDSRFLVKVGSVGSLIAAICCFTPLLVWLFTVIGASALIAYLDYVLLPSLGIFLVILLVGRLLSQRPK